LIRLTLETNSDEKIDELCLIFGALNQKKMMTDVYITTGVVKLLGELSDILCDAPKAVSVLL
jgi:hypothetical protein